MAGLFKVIETIFGVFVKKTRRAHLAQRCAFLRNYDAKMAS